MQPTHNRWRHRWSLACMDGVWWAWLTLVVCLGCTVLAWYGSKLHAEHAAHAQFTFRVGEIRNAINTRMLAYEKVLRGGVSLFNALGLVTRDTWHTYVAGLQIDLDYPGIQGVGFSLLLQPFEKAWHIQQIRAEGFPQYTIWPEGDRPLYTSIIYLEPFSGRNLRAFGFDMFSEAVRRSAMERARDSGLTAISGKVTLVQETNQGVQAGFLMYLPVYKKGLNLSTAEQRGQALLGYVYSPFRMNDLMQGIIGRELPDIDVTIFDGEQSTEAALMYHADSNRQRFGTQFQPAFTASETIGLHGHQWTLRFESQSYAEVIADGGKPLLVLLFGLTTSVLFCVVVWSITRTRARALDLASLMSEQYIKSEARLRAIVDNVVDGIITTDEQGCIESFNAAAEHIFGYGASDVIGQNVTMLMPEPVRSAYERSFEAYRTTGERQMLAVGREVVGRRQDGSEFPMDLALSEVLIEERRTVTGIVRDITERKKVERLKSEFISTVSHELRTPLTSIRGALGLIVGKMSGAFSEQANRLLHMALDNCERLMRLINDLLDIEKIESGKLQLVLHTQPLMPLIEQALEANLGYANTYGVQFVVVARVDDATVHVDGDRFTQVMANLLSNAAKFSSRGDQVQVAVLRQHGDLRIEIRDQGAGIPEEFQERIFQKFSQADASDSRQKGGTGLGLSISKALVESMGGRIGFTSACGRGTTFYCEFPERGGDGSLQDG